MSDNHKDRMAEAIRQAERSRAGSMLTVARRYFPTILDKGDNKGIMKTCPGCGDKGSKFGVFISKQGHPYWGCHKTGCQYHFENLKGQHCGDTIGLISFLEGKDRSEAVDIFLEIAGVHNPRHDLPERKPKTSKKSTAKTAPKPDKNDQTDSPDQPDQPNNTIPLTLAEGHPPPPPSEDKKTVFDEILSLLSLNAGDREQLKRKRGFSRETIEVAGYRSSVGDNRKLLEPILATYPPGILLSEGIATKDKETGELKLNSQLCGYGLKKRGSSTEDDEWDWVNPVLIPYFNSKGHCFAIRPHKGSLSGKRYMREQGYEHSFRSTRTRTHPYTSFAFRDRPEKWRNRCVLTEGEHKANALAQCGIPALAVPGIQMPRNENFFEALVTLLRDAGIREVIVAYDNEDKSGKPDPWTRYEADVYALFACHALRTAGFLTSHLTLPDDWRIEGKADWDGALANFGSKAAEKFNAALKKTKPYYPQTEIFGTNERDRVIHCKLNRLIFVPQILTGGEEEEDLARLLAKTCDPWHSMFPVRDMVRELFDTRGCYYVRKRLPREQLKPYFEDRKNILKQLAETQPDDLDSISGLEASLACVKHIITGRPEVLSDFTISCEFQVRTQSGEIHRLFRFKNKHGQASEQIMVPPSACSTSTKFREFCMGVGNFNPKIGDKQLQELMQDLGTFSAWREIRQLTMIGRDPESGLWIFGDCAFDPNADLLAPSKQGHSDVLFADKHDIIWHDGIGYRIDPSDLAQFVHKEPPRFFQVLGKEPADVFKEIKANPEREKVETAKVFLQLAADLICTFGDSSGLLVLGAVLGYAMAPELLAKYHGHPGLWIHGRAFAGKSETTRFLMQMWGYDPGYRTFMLSGGTTAVAIDRAFAQYGDIPIHADEFRQDEADKNRISSLRGPFNRQSKAKGKMDQTNQTRSVQPMTSPIVTGEGVTNDSATLSRYIEAILAADKRLGTKDEQGRRYQRMLGDSYQYHRIIRYLLLNRKWFGKAALEALNTFIDSPDVVASISSDRMRLSYGTAYCAFTTLMKHFMDALVAADTSATLGDFPMPLADRELLNDRTTDLRAFTLSYARNAAADVTSINFVVKYWSDVVTYLNINHSMKRFIWFARCQINPETNKVTVTTATTDLEGTVRCVIVKPKELYAEYQQESRKRGHEPELSISNIRAECQNERYWVSAPKTGRQAHRLTLDKDQIDVWILRTDRMDPSMENLFAEKFDPPEDESEEKFDFLK